MELWKIHRFCETATLKQLQETEEKLKALAQQQSSTNANKALEIVREYLELKRLFDED